MGKKAEFPPRRNADGLRTGDSWRAPLADFVAEHFFANSPTRSRGSFRPATLPPFKFMQIQTEKRPLRSRQRERSHGQSAGSGEDTRRGPNH